jgi:hypothetical protein
MLTENGHGRLRCKDVASYVNRDAIVTIDLYKKSLKKYSIYGVFWIFEYP